MLLITSRSTTSISVAVGAIIAIANNTWGINLILNIIEGIDYTIYNYKYTAKKFK